MPDLRPALPSALTRLRVPRSGLVLLIVVFLIPLVHIVGPAVAVPAGGPFPSGSFQLQSTVDGTCVAVVHGSSPGDAFRHGPVALVGCRVVPEQTWRYEGALRHLSAVSTLAGPCAEQGTRTVEVARCWSTLDGRRSTSEQWAMTADGAITGGELASLVGLVAGIPTRGCWQAEGQEIEVTDCRDAPAQRWRAVAPPS